MRVFCSAIFLSLCLALPARADIEEDKRLIAEAMVTDSSLDAAFQTLAPVLTDAIQTQLRSAGITVSDPSRFLQILIAEFRNRYASILREELRPALAEIFTEQEIADIASFIRSPSGARFFAAQGEMIQAGYRLGQVAGARAGQEAAERIAARLRQEGVEFRDAQGNRVDTLKFLRGN